MASALTKKPLYMITGVKIATGVSLSTSYSEGSECNAVLGIASTRPEYQHSSNNNNAGKASKEGPIVFAYQLMRVKLNEAGATVEPFTNGAAFAIGDEDDETEIEFELSEEAPESHLSADYSGFGEGKTEVLESFDETTKESCSVVALVH
ncbi:hypothetical protein BFW01_g5055 [Lasiodiplodia theobromae]|nr:hypothetical protein BFW01_g5055 [Lasiodiplodia theobromae]